MSNLCYIGYNSVLVNGGWTVWSRWGSWGTCQGSSCIGQQRRLRIRSCKNRGRHCRGPRFQWMSRSCKPVNSQGKSYLHKK